MLHFKLSNTALSSSGCSLKLIRQTIDGYREPELPARMVYGMAVHKFVDTMYKTGDMVTAVLECKKEFSIPKIDDRKSMHLSDEGHMLTTCMNLWTGFIQEDSTFDIIKLDGKPLTEQTFSFENFYFDDFIRVDLEGTQDKIGQFKGGCFAIGDWKITSSWDKVKYFVQYEMSRQLMLYRLASILESRTNPDSTLGRIGKTKVGCFIDAVFIKPDRNDMEVRRSDVFQYSDEDMKAFEISLYNKCLELSSKVQREVHLIKEGLINGTCDGKWGLCAFYNVCKSPDNIGKILLERDFVKRAWNPLDYNGADL